MNFLKTKTFKVLNIVSFAVLILIVVLNIISSLFVFGKALTIVFSVITIVGAIYVIGINILTIILFSKKNNKAKEKENED